MKAQRGSRRLYSFFNFSARWWVVVVTPEPLNRGKETRYPLIMMLLGPQDRAGQVREACALLGFDSRTIRSVAIRYTDRAVSAHECH
jgi:hypothetical protein